MLNVTVLVVRVANHESETILFTPMSSSIVKDNLYQGFSYLSRVIEYLNWEETTPKTPIFEALEKKVYCLFKQKFLTSTQMELWHYFLSYYFGVDDIVPKTT